MAFIGVDLHTNSVTICRLHDDGSEVFETFTLSARALQAFCLGLDADDDVAVEATGNTVWFCDEICLCVGDCRGEPAPVQVIGKSVQDRQERCAGWLFPVDMLPETRLKSTAEAELGSLVSTRDVLVKQRTMLLNKIHALLLRRGMTLKKEGPASKKRLRELDLSQFTALEQVELDALRTQALNLTETLNTLDKAIEAAGSDLPGHEGIRSIKGIGPRSAAILLAGIGNVDDVDSADKLAASVGASFRRSASPMRPTTGAGSPARQQADAHHQLGR